MKFSEVPENTEFYWNPRPDEIPSITCKAVKLPENAGFYHSYVEPPDLDDLEYVNAIGYDPDTHHYSGYTVPEDAQVELVDTPTKFKDIAVGVYFYRRITNTSMAITNNKNSIHVWRYGSSCCP